MSRVESAEIFPSQEAILSYPCLGCHPASAKDTSAIPYLGTMSQPRFVQTMLAFKNDQRPASVMGRIAKGYDRADFVHMARFFIQ